MSDDTTNRTPDDATDGGSGRTDSRLGAVRTSLSRRDAQGRPVGVYGIIGIGVATLLVLMLIIYFNSGDRDGPDQPICTTISPDQADQDVRNARIDELTLVYAEGIESPADSEWGPVQAQIDYVDGSCAYLPQGITNQSGLLMILGSIQFYNETTDKAQVTVTYSAASALDRSLYVTPTDIPDQTATAEPTEKPTAAITVPPGTPGQPPASPIVPIGPDQAPSATATDVPTRTPAPTSTR